MRINCSAKNVYLSNQIVKKHREEITLKVKILVIFGKRKETHVKASEISGNFLFLDLSEC